MRTADVSFPALCFSIYSKARGISVTKLQTRLLGRRGSLMLFLFSAQDEVFESYSSAPAAPWKREKAPQLISLRLRIHFCQEPARLRGFQRGIRVTFRQRS